MENSKSEVIIFWMLGKHFIDWWKVYFLKECIKLYNLVEMFLH